MKFGKSLSLADRLGARYAVILGEEELAAGQFTVKRLADANQKKLSEAELIAYLDGIAAGGVAAGGIAASGIAAERFSLRSNDTRYATLICSATGSARIMRAICARRTRTKKSC